MSFRGRGGSIKTVMIICQMTVNIRISARRPRVTVGRHEHVLISNVLENVIGGFWKIINVLRLHFPPRALISRLQSTRQAQSITGRFAESDLWSLFVCVPSQQDETVRPRRRVLPRLRRATAAARPGLCKVLVNGEAWLVLHGASKNSRTVLDK